MPGLDIMHQAGQINSNIDPLSRLPREAPHHDSPAKDDLVSIELSEEMVSKAEAREKKHSTQPACRAVTLATTRSFLERHASIATRLKAKKVPTMPEPSPGVVRLAA